MASDWERAGAVVNRLWDEHPNATINMIRDWDAVAVWVNDPDDYDVILWDGRGPTYVAALIDLGTRLDADTEAERQERED